MARRLFSSIEPLESRIAPAALTAINPLPDLVVGMGKTSAVIDLGNLYSAENSSAYHSIVQFTTNFDMDPVKAGLQAGVIKIELYDDVAPETVQNFLNYVNNLNTKGDYDGVFFHRSDPSLDIVQAGGFEVSNPSAHIATFPTVHNEYSEDYKNVAGTIALAKTAAGPNTGSSEFFFNLADNSNRFGSDNNGGYTVFGKVTQGFDVLQKIIAQPIMNATAATGNSALGTLPYQGTYDADPDHNAKTAPPVPSAANFITITSAKTIAAPNAVSPGVVFKPGSVYEHGSTTTSTLVKQSVVGDKLTLTFDTKQSGVADVTILAANPVTGETSVETFSVTLRPNLLLAGSGDSFQTLSGPGDQALGQAIITNNGGTLLDGKYTVNYYYSLVTATDTNGATLDSSDILLKSADHEFKVPSGKSALATDVLTLPKDLVSEQQTFRIITTITAADGNTVTELHSDDQPTESPNGTGHFLKNIFGSVVSQNTLVRSHSSLTYLDADGQTVVATLTGHGYGEVLPVYDADHNLIGTNIEFTDTSAITNITFQSVTSPDSAAGPVHTKIGTFRVNEDAAGDGRAIGVLNLGLVDLTRSLVATGGVKSLTLGDVLHGTSLDPNNYANTLTDEHLIFLGNSAQLAKVLPVVKLGNLDNTVIDTTQVLTSLSVASWKNDVMQETSTLAGVKSFTVAGGLQANLEISAAYGDAAFMNTNAAMTAATALFKVGGTLSTSTVKIAGNVGTVDLGAIYTSRFLVGADSVPTQVSQFNSIRTIASFIVRGVAGEQISMSDSQVAAANITSIKLSKALETTAGDDWGFVADKVGTYSRAAVAADQSPDGEAWNAVLLKNLTAGIKDAKGAYSVKLL